MQIRLTWMVAALALQTSAQNERINPDLVRELVAGLVSDFALTADGARVVYRADGEIPLRFELFSRPLDGSSPSLKLSGPMHAQGDVGVNGTLPGSFALGAGDRVVYLADELQENVAELFSVPADGSAPRLRLSQPGMDVSRFVLDPARTRVFYQLRGGVLQDLSTRGSLHAVPLDGSTPPVTLWPEPTGNRIWISPDGSRVVFGVRRAFPHPENPIFPVDGEELHVAASDGSTVPLPLARTHHRSSLFAYLDDVVFSPDGMRVAYHEVDDHDGDIEKVLYSVRLDGGEPEVLIVDPDSYFGRTLLVPSQPPRLVFQEDDGLHSTELDGSQPVQLVSSTALLSARMELLGTEVLLSTSALGSRTVLRVPADGSRPALALFPPQAEAIGERFAVVGPQTLAFVSSATGRRLQVVPLAGGTPLPLHPAPPAGQGPLEIVPHPDGQRLLFRGDLAVAGQFELHAAPLDASTGPTRLNAPLGQGEDVLEARPTRDGAAVVFRAGAGGLVSLDLLVVPADGSQPPLQLNEATPGPVVGDVTHAQVTSDGKTLVYRADQLEDEHFDLFAAALDSLGPPRALTAGLPSVDESFRLLEPGARLVFQADGGLYVAELSGAAPLRVDSGSFGSDWALDSTGRHLVYRRTTDPGGFELVSLLLDGQSVPLRLHPPLGFGQNVASFRLAADGTLVFRGDSATNDVFELQAVPLKGGVPRRVSGALVPGGNVGDYRLDPTGKFVAFVADARVDERSELFAVALAGDAPPERRSGDLPALGDVREFAFTGDGRRLVYRADQVSDNRLDLFSTPTLSTIGPAQGPRRSRTGATLLSRLPAGRLVQPDWLITPDGAAVVYRANPVARNELFRVGLDGHAAPASLSGGLVQHGNVLGFALAPGQGRVVYRADQRVQDRIELFSVPLAGGSPVPLDDLPAFGDVGEFLVAPGAREVVFRADRDTDGVFELYRVPVDAGAPARRENGDLPAGGDVLPDFAVLQGSTLYRADQVSDEVFELFLTR